MPTSNKRREFACSNLEQLAVHHQLWVFPRSGSEDETLSCLVRQAVEEALTDKQRQVIEGYFFEGLSQGELARRYGISQQVVHKRIYGVQRGGKWIGGALQKLREVLQPHMDERWGSSHAFTN
jgi:DNA-directed RNA polymerase specialized sigma24 family protein